MFLTNLSGITIIGAVHRIDDLLSSVTAAYVPFAWRDVYRGNSEYTVGFRFTKIDVSLVKSGNIFR